MQRNRLHVLEIERAEIPLPSVKLGSVKSYVLVP